jgi:uncharacterized membrane protein YukC
VRLVTGSSKIINSRTFSTFLQKQSKQMKRNYSYVRKSKDISFHIFRDVSVQIVVFEVVTVCRHVGKFKVRRYVPLQSAG